MKANENKQKIITVLIVFFSNIIIYLLCSGQPTHANSKKDSLYYKQDYSLININASLKTPIHEGKTVTVLSTDEKIHVKNAQIIKFHKAKTSITENAVNLYEVTLYTHNSNLNRLRANAAFWILPNDIELKTEIDYEIKY
ncbi:MAG: hypothetical protein N4A33_06130 [Bacteriovoracaceae bacterium]|jgi:hypothetical protein|nr:hypothetical protein [Bacteriovoracaceae bacterium]